MANRYANLVGSKRISEDFNNINIGFDRVQAEMDSKGTPADAQTKADEAKAAAIASAATSLAAHKARGADEHPAASGNAAGFMSAADKKKLDASISAATPDTLMQRDAAGRAKVTAPAAADDIARKAETDAVQANLDSHAADSEIHVTADEHAKLEGIAEGAEVNQNAFAKVNDVEAADPSDALQIAGGTGITVTTDPASKKLTVTATGTATPGAHASSHITGGSDVIPDAVKGGASGLMSGADAKFVREDGETKMGAQAKADAAETAAKEHADEQFESIAGRLDEPVRSSITLQPGLQVIQADQDSPFSLNSIRGRTLVNLLGRVGGGEQIPPIDSSNAATLSVDTSTKDTGLSSYKVTANDINVANAEHYIDLAAIKVKTGSFYVAVGMVKPAANATTSILVYGMNAGEELDFVMPSDTMSVTSVFSPAVVLFKSTTAVKARVRLRVQNTAGEVIYTPSGEYANFDSIRLYEVSETEYAALANMPLNQIAAKYPYVDSVQPVRNPYAIRYGENLLPPFYEWTRGSAFMLSNGYAGVLKNAINDAIAVSIPFKTEVEYTYSAEHTGAIAINAWDIGGNLVGGKSLVPYTTNQSVSFKVPIGTARLEAYFSNIVSDTQTLPEVSIKNPFLTIGNVVKPFKPREDAMLALQTDLYADSLTGANADEVFEKDGQYFKLAKWGRVVLDGNLGWAVALSPSGFKQIEMNSYNFPVTGNQGYTTKYNGAVLPNFSGIPASADLGTLSQATGRFYVTIANVDSGWGDAYTPTADEIKAYFMGWKMYDVTVSISGQGVYNGSGEANKRWAYRADGVSANYAGGVATIPTTQAPNWTPYQLTYQLATPTVEPITSEGQLTLIEGNNQVEVGTGIVLRENVKSIFANEYYRFNDTTLVGTTLKYKLAKPLYMYRNGQRDQGWEFISDQYAYGLYKARKTPNQYYPSATYTITYFMLDTFPAAPFVGSVADNEKALLTDLVHDVQQANARLSVVENKKAEKDSPAWIAPTLLNGWANNGNGSATAGYYKDGSGQVHIRGIIKSGVSNSLVFKLPNGYRPILSRNFPSVYYGTASGVMTSLATVNVDGSVMVVFDYQANWISLDGLSFLAEQ